MINRHLLKHPVSSALIATILAFLLAIGIVNTGFAFAKLKSPTPVAALVPLPDHVDVNGTQWNISQVDFIDDGGAYVGITDCSTRHIYVVFNKKYPQSHGTILVHELSHALVCTDAGWNFQPNNLIYNSTDAIKHEGIYQFAAMWAELLQRNPGLAEFISQKDR